jgi:hypothetical protein
MLKCLLLKKIKKNILFYYFFFFVLNHVVWAQKIKNSKDNCGILPEINLSDNNFPGFQNPLKVNYALSFNDINSELGSQIDSTLIVKFEKWISSSSLNISGQFELEKNFSSSSSIDFFNVISEQLSYNNAWISLSIGRLDIGDILSPSCFFGDYSTMGIRHLDGLQITIPVNFKMGITNYKRMETLSSSISFFYFPSVFKNIYVNENGVQDYFLGQIRVNLINKSSILRVNFGKSINQFYAYSIMSGHWNISSAINFNLTKQFSFDVEYGSQDTSHWVNSSVITYGLNFKKMIPVVNDFLFKKIIFEIQSPLGLTLDNSFTGGNGLLLSKAQMPQTSFFFEIKSKLNFADLIVCLTNSQGDYTFSRLNEGNAFSPIDTLLVNSVGYSNEIKNLDIYLSSNSYKNLSYLVNLEVEF